MNLCRLADRQVLNRYLCRFFLFIVGDDVRSRGSWPMSRFVKTRKLSMNHPNLPLSLQPFDSLLPHSVALHGLNACPTPRVNTRN